MWAASQARWAELGQAGEQAIQPIHRRKRQIWLRQRRNRLRTRWDGWRHETSPVCPAPGLVIEIAGRAIALAPSERHSDAPERPLDRASTEEIAQIPDVALRVEPERKRVLERQRGVLRAPR